MTRRAEMHINSDALLHNFNRVREFASHSKIIAMVKANAYGHDLRRVANLLKDADAFGVACLEEAKMIRQAGVTRQPIIIMVGFFSESELDDISTLNCEVVLHQQHQIEVLKKVHLASFINVWLKINTGMNRLGFLPEELETVYKTLRELNNVREIRLMTHFSDADNPTNPKTKNQIEIFNKVTKDFSNEKSLANSAGIIAFPESHADWVRPGLMLYGASPIVGKTAADFNLKPAMTLTSEILSVQHYKKSDQIGYGSTFICPENMPVGIAALGYGDGYPWHASGCAPILVKDHECQLAGRVSMDMLAIDLRNYPEAKIGDRVVLWGDGMPIERIAESANTIPYELLCGIVRRVYQKVRSED